MYHSDNYVLHKIGETGNVEYSWSNNINELIVQFFFQLVRQSHKTNLSEIHHNILSRIKCCETLHIEQFTMMYKLIGQTRDIVKGKGEQKLSFMQILGFYNMGYSLLAKSAFYHFVLRENNEHPFGSWKDVKYFCEYIKQHTHNTDHPLINYACELMLEQLKADCNALNIKRMSLERRKSHDDNAYTKQEFIEFYGDEEYWENAPIVDTSTSLEKSSATDTVFSPNVSLCAKWVPREKSKFDWVHSKLATTQFSYIMETANSTRSRQRAIKKCKSYLRKIYAPLNKYLDTVQIKQCSNRWRFIDFNNVTAITMHKQSKAFLNLNGKRTNIVNGSTFSSNTAPISNAVKEKDREKCALNLRTHVEASISDGLTNKIHSNPLSIHDLVKRALTQNLTTRAEINILNLQWENSLKKNKMLEKNVIAFVDTSYTMRSNNNAPLYSALGLGIRISELSAPPFQYNLLTFDEIPQWHNLKYDETFYQKINRLKSVHDGGKSNFYQMMQFFLDTCIANRIPAYCVSKMVIVILSDMQIDDIKNSNKFNSMYKQVTAMYKRSSLNRLHIPYTPPHIVFWNVKKTDGFPVQSIQKNVTMMSGTNPMLINILSRFNNTKTRNEHNSNITARNAIRNILNHSRYDVMNKDIDNFIKCTITA